MIILRVLERDEVYYIYVNRAYIKEVDFASKDSISKYAKELVLKLKRLYNIVLMGFYEMKVYVHKEIGIFVELKPIDDDFDFFTIDLKVIILLNQEFFLKTLNFDYVDSLKPLYYHNGYYYASLEHEKNYLTYLELGSLVYGKEVEEVKRLGLLLQSD